MNLNTEATILPLSMAERLDAQQELENLSMELGIDRYRKSLEADGTGALPPGQQLIKAAMEPMETALKTWLDETAQGLASRNAGVFYFINQLEPTATAWLTARAAIGSLHERPSLTSLGIQLSNQMESSLNLDAICKANPRLGAKMAKQVQGMGATRNIAVFIRKGAAMVDVKTIQWDDNARLRVGTLLLQMFAESTGLIAIETVTMGKRATTLVRPTEACRQWLEGAHARCELLSPVRMPMVSPPRDWTNPFNGGYLSPKLRQPLVKTRNRGYLTELKEWEMPWVYASVNALQATEWEVNQGIYKVAKALWEAGAGLAGLPKPKLDNKVELPAKTWSDSDTPSPEALHAWKVGAARAYDADAKAESKRLQLVGKLWVAEEMMARGNRFHYVYNMDWRGRLYPVAASLSPQGDDVAKAMLSFAQRSRLGEDGAYWLAIHTANSFGVDKVSFEERISWVEDHTQAIIDCGRDPLENRWWTEADSPFVFLAACMEYARLDAWVQAGGAQEDFESNLPVAFDGACNGLQNFSAMLRDPVGGAATGLVPGTKPADIYSEVAKAAQQLIDQDAREGSEVGLRWVGKMTRKLAKRNTMTVPYGVTRRGMRDQLYGELAESLPEHRGEDASYLAEKNFEAIGTVVVAARQAMDWLRDAAKVAASNELPVRWTTPAGFLAVQDYRVDEGNEVDFVVMGRRFRLMLQKTGDKLNTRKQSLGISPNFVHSLDAAHLMRTVLFCAQEGMVDFAMIHDSFGCHAGHASRLRDNLRAAFVEQYSAPVLEKFRDELAEQLPEELRAKLPELPPMGTLDLAQVEQSEYFFA